MVNINYYKSEYLYIVDVDVLGHVCLVVDLQSVLSGCVLAAYVHTRSSVAEEG